MFVWVWIKAANAPIMTVCTLKTIEVLSIGKDEWVDAEGVALVVTGPKTCPTGEVKYFE